MDTIYSEMFSRNTNWLMNNPIISDPLLLSPYKDHRRCIALVAKNPIKFINTDIISEICGPLSSNWMTPKIHSTFMVLRGWSESEFPNEDWSELKDIIQNDIPPYEIIFDQVIPVKTGLVLCGTPSININSIRDKIRIAGYETNVVYKCDIAHTTLLRWTHDIPFSTQQSWLQKIMSLPHQHYAKINVTGFDITLASWSMIPGTSDILDSVDLCINCK